jgi:hypothetical protein
MNWNRCSKALVATLLVLTAAVVPAAAVSTSSEGVPDEAQVGNEVSATFTLTELYTDYESWTLHGETNLTEVTWTVRKLDQAGNQVSQTSYDGGEFNESIDIEEDTAEVEIQVRGTTPEVRNFTYEPEQRFLLASFELLRQGGTQQDISETRIHYYTEDSKEARRAIENASATVESAGDSEAEATLTNAIEAYNNEEFGSATTFANNAEQQAQQAQNAQSRNQLILYAVAALLVVALLVGLVLYWRSQQDSYDKLG